MYVTPLIFLFYFKLGIFVDVAALQFVGPSMSMLPFTFNLGCILLGLFWLFLFWFRNNRIHGISIAKRTLLYVSDLETESEMT